ncbi:hypothetical protein RIF29_07819 [Crotalaria pallida]|uniref:Uncharacterized protein n=1 Tax=Crotalaria pallida TaxID=3830 RepID=A0AAN9PB01_CROPI
MEVTASPPKRHTTNGFTLTMSVVLALLTKGAGCLARKPKAPAMKAIKDTDDDWKIELRSPKSPLARVHPKKLLSNISSKSLLPFVHKKNRLRRREQGEESWGDGGVWQKEILMGGKCEPLDFSGVIYYDSTGKQMREIPLRSPRASPSPGYLARIHH